MHDLLETYKVKRFPGRVGYSDHRRECTEALGRTHLMNGMAQTFVPEYNYSRDVGRGGSTVRPLGR